MSVDNVVNSGGTTAKWFTDDKQKFVDFLLQQQAEEGHTGAGWKPKCCNDVAVHLADSEKVSGGIAKNAQSCKTCWQGVRLDSIYA